MIRDNARVPERRTVQAFRGQNLPRNGNVLPREQLTADDVAKSQGDVLRGVFGELKSPAKTMARITGDSERACRNQYAGLNSMQLHKFFNACQAIPEMQAWGAMMMGIPPTDPRFQQEMARGTGEIVLRIDTGGLTFSKGEE